MIPENDLSNIDCRKSNLNKLTQNIPEPLRATVFALCEKGCKVTKITKLTDHYYAVELANGDRELYHVIEQNYWDSLSHIEVDDAIPLPIQPH